MPKEKTKILILDDHKLFLEGMSLLLSRIPHLEVVCCLNNPSDALKVLKYENPDIILSDYYMSEMTGTEFAQLVRKEKPKQKIALLTSSNKTATIIEALNHDIDGYIIKDASKHELTTAIDDIMKNKKYFSPEIKERYSDYIFNYSQETPAKLSSREKEILTLFAKEMKSKEIAERLFLSINTVETHRKNIMKKLNITNHIGLYKYALINQLI